MNAERWTYLKALTPPAPRVVWPAEKGTCNIGRNAAKRAVRDALGRKHSHALVHRLAAGQFNA